MALPWVHFKPASRTLHLEESSRGEQCPVRRPELEAHHGGFQSSMPSSILISMIWAPSPAGEPPPALRRMPSNQAGAAGTGDIGALPDIDEQRISIHREARGPPGVGLGVIEEWSGWRPRTASAMARMARSFRSTRQQVDCRFGRIRHHLGHSLWSYSPNSFGRPAFG